MKQEKSKKDIKLPYYPRTTIPMIPGDVLYSHKYALSSLLVGHTGIVGTDFRIYHVNRWGKLRHADTVPMYLSRHRKGEKITILRYSDPIDAKQAALWAEQNHKQVKRYFYTRNLRDVENNYCSKFTWQAYYFGTEGKVNLLQNRRTIKHFVMPGTIYRQLDKIGRFDNVLFTI